MFKRLFKTKRKLEILEKKHSDLELLNEEIQKQENEINKLETDINKRDRKIVKLTDQAKITKKEQGKLKKKLKYYQDDGEGLRSAMETVEQEKWDLEDSYDSRLNAQLEQYEKEYNSKKDRIRRTYDDWKLKFQLELYERMRVIKEDRDWMKARVLESYGDDYLKDKE